MLDDDPLVVYLMTKRHQQQQELGGHIRIVNVKIGTEDIPRKPWIDLQIRLIIHIIIPSCAQILGRQKRPASQAEGPSVPPGDTRDPSG
jgi:hypothetical protein